MGSAEFSRSGLDIRFEAFCFGQCLGLNYMMQNHGAPRSKIFDDVYFSAEDGLAETRHVFLDGNDLPDAWLGRGEARGEFVIAETGFGTGLNFLAAWKLFEETAAAGQHLRFISVEKYPLSYDEVREALSVWDELADYTARFCEVYSCEQNVLDVQVNDRVRITVYFGDVVDGLAQVEAPVDAWFLDGFKPSSNPDMWSEAVFAHMARLSRSGASFATFTAVGAVRRGLRDAGFAVRRVKGFSWKWHMSVGVFE